MHSQASPSNNEMNYRLTAAGEWKVQRVHQAIKNTIVFLLSEHDKDFIKNECIQDIINLSFFAKEFWFLH